MEKWINNINYNKRQADMWMRNTNQQETWESLEGQGNTLKALTLRHKPKTMDVLLIKLLSANLAPCNKIFVSGSLHAIFINSQANINLHTRVIELF